eukprot:1040059-Pelagomonas_calceolata.AAC.5
MEQCIVPEMLVFSPKQQIPLLALRPQGSCIKGMILDSCIVMEATQPDLLALRPQGSCIIG